MAVIFEKFQNNVGRYLKNRKILKQFSEILEKRKFKKNIGNTRKNFQKFEKKFYNNFGKKFLHNFVAKL